jgi:hypothetical protein
VVQKRIRQMRWFNVFLISFLCFSGSRVMAAGADSRESIFGRDVESGSPIEVVVTGGREPAAFDETVLSTPGAAQIRSHHSVRSDLPPEIGLESVQPDFEGLTEGGSIRFNVAAYFDREQYIRKKVEELIKLEMAHDFRAGAYTRIGTICMWGAGVAVGGATIIAIVSSASIVDPHLGNVLSACLSAGSGVCMWAGGQFKKTSLKYEEASRKIKLSLGLPQSLISPNVDIRIDPLRLGPAEEGSAVARATFRRAVR